MNSFSFPVRVYYEDTDAGGVVYHANYLMFFERARTEFLRHLGFSQSELKAKEKVIFVVRSLQIKYLQPALFDELLEVVSSMQQQGRSAMLFEQALQRGDTTLTRANVEVVCVSTETFKPVAIPATILTKITS
ncbi:MAG TPA: tol-pal system-associated acyl-CoA thioesterase [Methylophilaceae bacterium]